MKLRQRLSSPLTLISALEWFMDIIAFAALFATREVEPWSWAVSLSLITTRIFVRFRLGTRLFALGFAAVFGVTLYLAFGMGYHPVSAIVQTVPILHALVIFSRDKEQYQGWRLGIGFTELVVAAAMTPDFVLPILVFLFVMAALTLVSSNFVVKEARRNNTDTATLELPAGFLGWIGRQALVIFFVGAIIFPILPRITQKNSGGISTGRTTGYTEEVNLTQWAGYSEGSSAPVVRIIAENPDDFGEFIFRGLLRSRILNQFDGKSWKQVPVKSRMSLAYFPQTRDLKKKKLQFQREPLATSALPVPYGYAQVQMDQYGYSFTPERSAYEEVQESRFHDQKANYRVSFIEDAKLRRSILLPRDKPTVYDTEIPENIRNSRFERVAENLFRGITDPQKKVDAVIRLFIDQKFHGADELSESAKNLYDPSLSPLENFFFRTREGNCELFSSSAATLLRLGGVPTRVVAGFRVTRNPTADILTVRMSDAHAWVEVYYPERGWFPVDLTPRILVEVSVLDWFRDGYDWASATWNRYILNYGEDSTLVSSTIRSIRKRIEQWGQPKDDRRTEATQKESWQIPVALVGAAVFLAFVIYSRRRRIENQKAWQGPPALRRERRAMDRLLTKLQIPMDDPRLLHSEIYREWKRQFTVARFGPESDVKAEAVADIQALRYALSEEIRRSNPHANHRADDRRPA